MLFLAGSLLGVGFFTYIAAVALMPLYLLVTLVALVSLGDRPARIVRHGATAVAGFVWPLALSIPFHVKYPQFFADQFGRYGPQQFKPLDPFQQISELFNYLNVSTRVGLYFDFFNPAYLFLTGGSNPVDSTRFVGVFLLPLAVFIPIGIHQALTRLRTQMSVLVVAGFALAPAAALLMLEAGAIDRELVLLPFGALLATYGLEYLWTAPLSRSLRLIGALVAGVAGTTAVFYAAWRLAHGGPIPRSTIPLILVSIVVFVVAASADRMRCWQPIAIALLGAGVVQFAAFEADYLGDYRNRTADHFGGNLRAAIEAVVVARPPVEIQGGGAFI